MIFSRWGVPAVRTWPNKAFLVFVAALIVLIPFSLLPIHSVQAVIWWIVYLGIFLSFQGIVRDERILKWISGIFVALTAIFGVMSILAFIQIGLTAYNRLDGIVGNHNVYGGFLLIPLLLSLYFSFKGSPIWQRILWIISSVIIFSSIILTFSRGTWLSLVAAVIISLVLFRKSLVSLAKAGGWNFKKPLFVSGVLIASTVLMTGGIWLAARHNTVASNLVHSANTIVFSNEDSDNNAFTARLHYFADALRTFTHNPLIGFGSGNYASALRIFKTDPNYGSFADPHNWLLRMMVEDGIFAALLFVIFLGSYFWEIWKLIKGRLISEPSCNSWLFVSIFTGLIASTVHGLMDFDWSYNLVLLVFFCFAGALYGVIQEYPEFKRQIAKPLPAWINYAYIVVLIVACLVTLQIFRATSARAIGDYDLSIKHSSKDTINTVLAIDDYNESVKLNPYDPLTQYYLWGASYDLGDYKAARISIEKAISLFPQSGTYYSALATTDEAEKDYSGYEGHLLKAIQYFPASDLTNEVKLANFYYANKKYQAAIALIDKVSPIYTHYQSVLWYSSDPNSATMSANLKKLNDLKVKIAGIR